ncbi:MAG: aminoglycoside phosphotransferase family protein [Gemmatales bacterium]|nr:aminoglycoside phosphotransferase family protein [Gemmatales bacterium]MDW8388383.1 aminoglycoside phosphotransferase family protein [Gemmatales bacterium]
MNRFPSATPISPPHRKLIAEEAAVVLAVCRAFGIHVLPEAVESLGNAGGFSGARLWRVSAEGLWCLRAWPVEGPTRAELIVIHDLMLQAAAVLPFVPRLRSVPGGGQTCIFLNGRLWEMTTWQPGQADFHADPTPSKLIAAVEALARLHRVWTPHRPDYGICPAVLRRMGKLEAWQALPRERMESALGQSDADLRPWAEQALDAVRRWFVPAWEALTAWSKIAVPLQPCLCDVWHDHILFQGETVTGIVDYGSVRLDNPATDLARLLGSMLFEAARPAEGVSSSQSRAEGVSPPCPRLRFGFQRAEGVSPPCPPVTRQLTLPARLQNEPARLAADIARPERQPARPDENARRHPSLTWSQALDAYDGIRPLSEPERKLAEVLDWTGVVVALTNWLRWLVLGERRFENPTEAAKRMRSLTQRAACRSFPTENYRFEN